MDPLLFVGCRRSLTDDDLANCPGEINSKRLLSLFNRWAGKKTLNGQLIVRLYLSHHTCAMLCTCRYWQFECSIRSDNPRLWLVVVKCLWWRMLLQIVLVLAVVHTDV